MSGLPWPARRWQRVLAVAGLVLAALVLLAALVPWNLLRGPIERALSARTGRSVHIGALQVRPGRITRVVLEQVRLGNPDWAQDRDLLQSRRAEIHIRLWPLLRHRRLELPWVRLEQPQASLQALPDGRRSWVLQRGGTASSGPEVRVEALVVDRGEVHYLAPHQGADLRLRLSLDDRSAEGGLGLPLRFRVDGRWQGQPLTAEGRTGDVIALQAAALAQPFALQIRLESGATRLQLEGQVASLATLDGTQARFTLQGRSLSDLYALAGLALPATPRYAVAGRVARKGPRWEIDRIDAVLGRSDLSGRLSFTPGQPPQLAGALRARVLDLQDLGPLIGLEDRIGRPQRSGIPRSGRPGKVLPDKPVDLARLRSLQADVEVEAGQIVHAGRLSLDHIHGRVRLRLRGGVLELDPLALGVADGQLTGRLMLDGSQPVPVARLNLQARGLALARLLPAVESSRASVGRLQGQVDLQARGASVARLLGSADGSMALLMGRGRISNLLLEYAGLNGGEILKFFLEGDRQVPVRCAALAFDVRQGLMQSRALLLDTGDTLFDGRARIDLARETLDALVRPQPKDTSILSLRTPLRIGGTLAQPTGRPEAGPLAARAAAALALGAINPLLALAATIETGPGEDADCAGTLQRAGQRR